MHLENFSLQTADGHIWKNMNFILQVDGSTYSNNR